MLSEAQSFWDAISGKIKQLIRAEIQSTMRCERYEVTTAPDGAKIGVTKPFGTHELMLPYSAEVATASVGDPVLVVWWHSMSNAKVYYYADGFAGSSGGGGGGTSDYTDLTNKPSINGVTLSGNKTAAQLNLGTYTKPVNGIPASDLASGVIPEAYTSNPSALGTASPGSSNKWARGDHVHEKPTYSKSDVGLGNVDNVQQYSASNPPPYPVTSVNGATGAVTVAEVFWATYGTTTNDEIHAAVTANKVVLCERNGNIYILEFDDSEGFDYFSCVDGENRTIKTLSCEEDVWSNSAQTIGSYSKPSGGIPKTDLASAVQTSLGKADTALQSAPVTSVDGKTGAVTILPSGGTTGQVLKKTSGTDYAVEWANESGGGGGGVDYLTVENGKVCIIYTE